MFVGVRARVPLCVCAGACVCVCVCVCVGGGTEFRLLLPICSRLKKRLGPINIFRKQRFIMNILSEITVVSELGER